MKIREGSIILCVVDPLEISTRKSDQLIGDRDQIYPPVASANPNMGKAETVSFPEVFLRYLIGRYYFILWGPARCGPGGIFQVSGSK